MDSEWLISVGIYHKLVVLHVWHRWRWGIAIEVLYDSVMAYQVNLQIERHRFLGRMHKSQASMPNVAGGSLEEASPPSRPASFCRILSSDRSASALATSPSGITLSSTTTTSLSGISMSACRLRAALAVRAHLYRGSCMKTSIMVSRNSFWRRNTRSVSSQHRRITPSTPGAFMPNLRHFFDVFQPVISSMTPYCSGYDLKWSPVSQKARSSMQWAV